MISPRLAALLDRRSVFIALLMATGSVTLAMMWATRHVMLSDAWSYIALAEGILHGEYSMWWPLEGHYPDTFRAPGYPLLVAVVMAITGTWKSMPWVNLALYAFALWSALELIKRIEPRRAARSLFLLLLLPLVNVPYYITQVYTEVPVLAGLGALLLMITRPGPRSWRSSVLLGLLFGALFLLKPVLQLLPLAFVIGERIWLRDRVTWPRQLAMLAVCALTMLPYGLWNKRNHGVFSTTPLEGAGSYMHFGAWCGKFPGYTEHVYWHNFAGDELVRFVPDEEIPRHIAAYEAEWDAINARLRPLLTPSDSLMLASRDRAPYGVVNTYNTRYTRLREQLLLGKAIEHYRRDPWYLLKYKAYSAVRLWVIGIQRDEFRQASASQKIRSLYASVSTGIVFLLFMILIPLAMARRRVTWAEAWPMLAGVAYFGIMHLPFTIQARYTTPVRMAMLALLAVSICRLLARGVHQPAR